MSDVATESFDPAVHRPFTEGVKYLGEFETGLYPGGKNEIPEAHRKVGERIAAQIRPLNSGGKPDDRQGRVLAVVKGHSNCQMYFDALLLAMNLKERAGDLHPRFEMLNAAIGGQQLPEISVLQGRVWDRAKELLDRPGYSAQQVQVLFFHTTYHGAGNRDKLPPGEFPLKMRRMKRDLASVLEHCVSIYPNLRIAYLTCDGFRHLTGFEPHVWREAFGYKWLIEGQIKGEAGTEFDGPKRKLPWLQWGPYIWDSTWDAFRFTDGVHPAVSARALFVEKYWQFLKSDPVAKGWLWKT